MRTHLVAWAFGSSIALTYASFDGNINYHSPSSRHVNMGLDVHTISRRSWKRGAKPFAASDLNFTHGVASGMFLASLSLLTTNTQTHHRTGTPLLSTGQ